MTELIFMLTQNDVTIPNAVQMFEDVKHTGIKYVGCKDIGLPIREHEKLFKKMKKAEMTTFLEVVSHDKEKHFNGVRKAIRLEADYLIGGMPQFAKMTLEYLKEKNTKTKFFPYIGEVVGHPCVLKGKIESIVKNGLDFEKTKMDGVNLLLYRYEGDANLLLEKITEALHIPIIPAGGIDSFKQIDILKQKDVWAFTIGTAILEKRFVSGKGVKEQIKAVLNRLQ